MTKELACAILYKALNDSANNNYRGDTDAFFGSRWCEILLGGVDIDQDSFYKAVQERRKRARIKDKNKNVKRYVSSDKVDSGSFLPQMRAN